MNKSNKYILVEFKGKVKDLIPFLKKKLKKLH